MKHEKSAVVGAPPLVLAARAEAKLHSGCASRMVES